MNPTLDDKPAMKTSYAPGTLDLTIIRRSDTTEFFEPELKSEQEPAAQNDFGSMSMAQKRFHILFYTLAAVTGLVTVQLVWQVAELTIP